MSLEQKEPSPDSGNEGHRLTSELWGEWGQANDGRQPQRSVPGGQVQRPAVSGTPSDPGFNAADSQFTHSEHVSGALPAYPSEAPLFRPARLPYPEFPGYQPPGQAYPAQQPAYPSSQPTYPGYQGYQPAGQIQGQGYAAQRPVYPAAPPHAGSPGSLSSQQHPAYQGYAPPQPGYAQPRPGYPPYNGPVPYPPYGYYPYAPYGPYGYAWQPPQPKRDGYLLGVAISALVGSSLVLLGGMLCLPLLALFAIVPNQNTSQSSLFASIVLFITLALVGIVGGIAGLYHSIRSVFLKKPSSDFALPPFWIFVILYVVVVGAGFALHLEGESVAFPALTVVLILLAGIFPALAVLALGVRRLHFPKSAPWPTSWRRFTLALISGATLSVTLAGILELALGIVLIHGQQVNPLACADQPNLPSCQNPGIYNLLLIMVAVIAPIVEETVKPLAVVVLVGRVRSASEAFTLGLACGIGFDLVETAGYISSGYNDWLNVALIRTGAGLLHGFGAAMVALGWYYLVHGKRYRVLLAFSCWLYAVLQHAIWNGSWGLSLLPGPIGSFFNNASVTIGSVSLSAVDFINIVEALFMLAFFIYMTGRLRTKTPSPPALQEAGKSAQMDEKRVVTVG